MILLDHPILKDPLSIIVSCMNMKQILNFISISKYFYEIFTNKSNPCVFYYNNSFDKKLCLQDLLNMDSWSRMRGDYSNIKGYKYILNGKNIIDQNSQPNTFFNLKQVAIVPDGLSFVVPDYNHSIIYKFKLDNGSLIWKKHTDYELATTTGVGLSIAKDKIILINPNKKLLNILNLLDGNHIKTIHIPTNWTSSCAVNKNGTIVVITDVIDECIYLIDLDGSKPIKKIFNFGLLNDPYDICFSKDETNLIVAEPYNRKIKIVNFDGTILNEICTKYYVKGISIDHFGNIIALMDLTKEYSEFKNNDTCLIQIFNESGELIEKELGKNRFREGSVGGIAIDQKYGNIVVIENNNFDDNIYLI